MNFTIIINPEDGPGQSAAPAGDYVTEIQNLSSFDNVRIIGYVRTHWATRNISAVLDEVQTYSGWAEINSSDSRPSPMGMHGIFFDETPNEYSAEVAEYLSTINEAAKSADGLLGTRTVVHNPGTRIDERLEVPNTDIIVAFESDFGSFKEDKSEISSLPLDRSKYSFMVNSAPSGGGHLRNMVDSMSQHAEYLFATDLTDNYYQSFSPDWDKFIDAVPT